MKVINYSPLLLVPVLLLSATEVNASALQSAGAFTNNKYFYNAPGVVAPSFPLFQDNKESVSVTKKGSGVNSYWQLKGSSTDSSVSSLLLGYNNKNKRDNLVAGNDKVTYTANFNSSGQLITNAGSTKLSNFLDITGSLDRFKFGNKTFNRISNERTLLLHADLLDSKDQNSTSDLVGVFNDDKHGGYGLGFGTKFTGGWATQQKELTGGSTGESLWLFGSNKAFNDLVKALDGNKANGTLSTLFKNNKTISGVSSISAVPVPGAVWLFLTGMLTVLGLRRKKAV